MKLSSVLLLTEVILKLLQGESKRQRRRQVVKPKPQLFWSYWNVSAIHRLQWMNKILIVNLQRE